MLQDTHNQINVSSEERKILNLFSALHSLLNTFYFNLVDTPANETDGLCLSRSHINICKSFYKKSNPTDKDLFLLNSFASAFKQSPSDFAITQFSTNEDYIAATYKDAMEKHSVIFEGYSTPCNIGRLLSLGGEAVRYGKPRAYKASSISTFAEKNNDVRNLNCLFDGFYPVETESCGHIYRQKNAVQTKNKALHSCKVAIIYDRKQEGERALEKFFSNGKNLKNLVSIRAYDPKSLMTELIKELNGIKINADGAHEFGLLPQMPKDYRGLINSSLSLFGDALFNNAAVVAIGSKARIKKLCASAEAYGLSVCRAISISKTKNVSVTSCGKQIASVRYDLLYAIRDMIGHKVKVSTKALPEKPIAVVSEKIYESESKNDAVYKAQFDLIDGKSAYHSALYSAAALVLRAISDGFCLKESELAFTFSASLCLENGETVGDGISAILGLYRVMAEFEIADQNSKIEFSENCNEFTVFLTAHRRINEENPLLSKSVGKILESVLDENLTPNFTVLRDFALGKCSPTVIDD